MILSHTHRFIFIKTRKTGGTSVEIGLSRQAGPADIITPITPRDELVRLALATPCQNFHPDAVREKTYLDALRAGEDVRKLVSALQRDQRYFNHMTYRELAALNPRELDAYEKISIERHPYEKAVSWANFQIGFKSYTAGGEIRAGNHEIVTVIDELLGNGVLRQKIRNWEAYAIGAEIRVNTILQHATLQSDYAALCQRLGLPGDNTLPLTKVGERDRSQSARELLSPRQREAIQDICAEEFEYFGYER